MIIDRYYNVDFKLTFNVDHSFARIGGPLTKGELLIFAVLIYTSKGDLSIPLGLSYRTVKRCVRFELDVTQKEYFSSCKELSYRRGWVEDRLGMVSMLWFESFQRQAGWCVFKFNSNVVRVVNRGNYMEIVRVMLRQI